MIRRTFLGSLLGGLGLGAFLPKAKAAPVVTPFPVPFKTLGPENYCITFTHQHEPKVDHYEDVVVYGMLNGRTICQLVAQFVTITQRTYGAAAKSLSGEIVWKSPPPYRTETEVNLSGLFGPNPLMATLASIFGDVMQAKNLSLAFVMPSEQKRVDVHYTVLARIGHNVGAAGSTFWTGASFLGAKVEEKHDQWSAADLQYLPANGIRSYKALDSVGWDWKVEQERLLDEQLASALR